MNMLEMTDMLDMRRDGVMRQSRVYLVLYMYDHTLECVPKDVGLSHLSALLEQMQALPACPLQLPPLT
jgi:hypothetical protein